MSEYQYYEFQAVDRPLTNEQIRELRRYSSRAEIAATAFIVEYNWGDFKGDPQTWMEKYFDAFVHLANWGSRWFMLRVPSDLLDAETVSQYCDDDYLCYRASDKNLILSFRSDDEDRDWVDGEGWLSSLIALRADLLKGDRRCLYLAWLRSIQRMDYEDDTAESRTACSCRIENLEHTIGKFCRFSRHRFRSHCCCRGAKPGRVTAASFQSGDHCLAGKPISGRKGFSPRANHRRRRFAF
jgi:hypothetical protein